MEHGQVEVETVQNYNNAGGDVVIELEDDEIEMTDNWVWLNIMPE